MKTPKRNLARLVSLAERKANGPAGSQLARLSFTE